MISFNLEFVSTYRQKETRGCTSQGTQETLSTCHFVGKQIE